MNWDAPSLTFLWLAGMVGSAYIACYLADHFLGGKMKLDVEAARGDVAVDRAFGSLYPPLSKKSSRPSEKKLAA